MMVKTLKSEAKRRGHNLKSRPINGHWYRNGKVHTNHKVIPASQKINVSKEVDKDFEEGLKDLFENYDTTLKNLVNK